MISERTKRNGLTRELEIFDRFEVDYKLPKNSQLKEGEYIGSFITVGDNSLNIVGGILDNSTIDNGISSVWVTTPITGQDSDVSWGQKEKFSFRKWLIKLLENQKTRLEGKKMKHMTIQEFFIGLSKSYDELTPIAEIAEHYEKAIIQASTMGQVSLVEKLKEIVDVARGEAHLIPMGLKKYVTEKQVIDFYDKVGEDKNLKLTWIKNFGRIIPEEVYQIKKEVDERKIFDNYVILHYDPENNGEKLTKAEVEKKKDPILFGVIRNSRKLYYIADWKDDYCELTLEEMFKVLKGKVLQINNKTVKTFIDKTKAD